MYNTHFCYNYTLLSYIRPKTTLNKLSYCLVLNELRSK